MLNLAVDTCVVLYAFVSFAALVLWVRSEAARVREFEAYMRERREQIGRRG